MLCNGSLCRRAAHQSVSPDVAPAAPVKPTVPRRRRALIDDQRAAAGRLGVTLDDYRAHTAAGERWCPKCHGWLPAADFSSRSSPYCRSHMLDYKRAWEARRRGELDAIRRAAS